MTIDDITIHRFSDQASQQFYTVIAFFVVMGILLVVVALSFERRKLAAFGAFALLAVTGITAIAVSQSDDEAIPANARTLQAWTESDYGITVSDREALRIMGLMVEHGPLMGARQDLVFDADTSEGPIQLELVQVGRSFELIKIEPLAPAGTDGK